MDVDPNPREIKLSSSEGESFLVPVDVVIISKLVHNAVTGGDDSQSPKDFPLRVRTHTLRKIIDFCEHHFQEPMRQIEKPIRSRNMSDVVQPWYANFLPLEKSPLVELLLAANYMDIEPLLNLTAAAVAVRIKGMTKEQMRNVFNIDNDFTEEEEVKLELEYDFLNPRPT